LKNPAIPNFTKIRPVRAKLFHAGVRTDVRTYNNSRFCYTAENISTSNNKSILFHNIVISRMSTNHAEAKPGIYVKQIYKSTNIGNINYLISATMYLIMKYYYPV